MTKYDTIFFTYPIVDMIVPFQGQFPIDKGKTYIIETITNEPGGPANIVICGKRLGLNTLVVGYIGDDMYGDYLLSAYKKEGLDISQITKVPGFETRKVLVLVDSDGNHSFISMIEGVEKPFENKLKLIKNSKALCFSGYYIALENIRDDFMEVLRLSYELGLKIFFDPGPLVKMIPDDYLDEILSYSSVVLVNDDDASLISSVEDVEESAVFISNKTSGWVVVKSGSKGCFIIAEQGAKGKWYQGFKVNTVDTTGAGDSFWSAFMYGFIKNWDIQTIAYFSNAVGAAKVQKLGSGTQVPNFEEVVSVLENSGFFISDKIKSERDFSQLVLIRQ